MSGGYRYVRSEETLWTVGTGSLGHGTWLPESDHGSPDEAARRVAWLNGSPEPGPLSDRERLMLRLYILSLNVTGAQTDGAVATIASILGRFVSDGPAVTLHVDEMAAER